MPRKYSVKKGGNKQRGGGILDSVRNATGRAMSSVQGMFRGARDKTEEEIGKMRHAASHSMPTYGSQHHGHAAQGSHMGVRGGRRTRRRSRGGSGKGNGQSHKASGLTSEGTYLDMLNAQSQTGGRKGKHPKKGQKSRTMKGKEDFTTKIGNKFFNRRGHRQRHGRRSRKIRLPYEGGMKRRYLKKGGGCGCAAGGLQLF